MEWYSSVDQLLYGLVMVESGISGSSQNDWEHNSEFVSIKCVYMGFLHFHNAALD